MSIFAFQPELLLSTHKSESADRLLIGTNKFAHDSRSTVHGGMLKITYGGLRDMTHANASELSICRLSEKGSYISRLPPIKMLALNPSLIA